MSRPQREPGLSMSGRPQTHRRFVLVGCLLVALFAVSACDDGAAVATGIVIEVRQSGPATVTGFTLRADDGRLLDFQVGETSTVDRSFPSVHLRDHLTSSERVTVRYVTTEDGLIAIRLADAP